MTKTLRYSTGCSCIQFISLDIVGTTKHCSATDHPGPKQSSTWRPVSLAIISIVLFILGTTISSSSFAGLVAGSSHCIAASESDAPEGSGDEKKPETETPSTDEAEEDCD